MKYARLAAAAVTASGAVCAVVPTTAQAETQPMAPLHHAERVIAFDSGVVSNTSAKRTAVFSEVLAVNEADWLRLTLNGTELPAGVALEIVSLADGGTQRLDALTLEQWGHTSAYFNGDAVLVELIAEPGAGPARVVVDSAFVGEPGASARATGGLCGGTDTRTASADPRVGQVLPSQCSAWIADDCANCLISDGLCSTSTAIVSFNVPPSEPGCGFVFASPDDQYAVDRDSVQSGFSSGIGGNWKYFGVFPNSNTGLSPAEAQGAFFTRAQTIPASGDVTLIGYGGTEGCFDLSQSSSTGPIGAVEGDTVACSADAAIGDFGGPVVLESTGEVVGTLSYVGCDVPATGGNLATRARFDNTQLDSLSQAIARPRGVCVPPEPPAFDVAGGLPRVIAPQGAPISVTIAALPPIVLDPATAVVRVQTGAGVTETSLVFDGVDTYTGTLPGGACGDDAFVRIAIDAQPTNLPAKSYAFPADRPWRAVYADSVDVLAAFDMETDPGWTLSFGGGTSAGGWDRAVPADYGRGDPVTDADGSGQAFVTGAMPQEDLDGGPTLLTTMPFDLTQLDNPELVVSLYHFAGEPDGGVAPETLDVEVSDDNGATWTLLDSRPHSGAWDDLRYDLAGFAGGGAGTVLRFSAVDAVPSSIIESAIDAVQIRSVACNACPADVNGDGALSPDDFNAWVAAFNTQSAACDQNADGACNPADFSAWVINFNAGC